MFQWLEEHQALLWSLSAASLVMFVGSLFIMPAIIVRIRDDYFAHDQRPPARWVNQHPVVRIILHVFKNLLGIVLMLAGLAMLVLPGQGLLTLVVGFFMLDFPGKYRFERWMIARRIIHRPLNWLRRRAGRPPLLLHASYVDDQSKT